jgi:hypothetical protein
MDKEWGETKDKDVIKKQQTKSNKENRIFLKISFIHIKIWCILCGHYLEQYKSNKENDNVMLFWAHNQGIILWQFVLSFIWMIIENSNLSNTKTLNLRKTTNFLILQRPNSIKEP